MTLEPQRLSIDWQHLHQISDGDVDFELELLRLFWEDTQVHLGNLQRAIAADDADRVMRAAHHIKGASANVGLREVSQFAAILERQARQNQLQTSQILLAPIEKSLQQLQAYLKSQA